MPERQRSYCTPYYGRITPDLAATGGIHQGVDVVRMLMAGARVTMLVTALLGHGIEHLQTIEQELERWLAEHEYHSVRQLQGTMSQAACSTPSEFERVQYMKAIQTYQPHPVKSRFSTCLELHDRLIQF